MPSYLEKRRQGWYAVLDVPTSIQSKIGKKRLVRSLGTQSLREAEDAKHGVIAEWKQLFAAVKAGGDSSLEAARAEAAIFAREWREKAHLNPEDFEIGLSEYADRMEHRFGEAMSAELTRTIRGSDLVLADHAEAYLAQLSSTPKTIDIRRNELRAFTRRFKLASDVSSRELKAWFRDLTSVEGLAVKTQQRYLSTARGYWEWLSDEEILSSGVNPFLGLTLAKAKASETKANSKTSRKPFSQGDLRRLLEAAIEKDREVAQLIWLGMWTGARIEELCSLQLAEVFDEHIAIKDAKTQAGEREIPIHPALQPLVQSLRSRSHDGYLLSGLSPNKYGDRSNAVGKRFGRLKQSLGYGPEYVFHSIRKSAITEMENLGVPENVAARIHGHKLQTMSYGHYSGGLTLNVMAEALGRVDYGLTASDQRAYAEALLG